MTAPRAGGGGDRAGLGRARPGTAAAAFQLTNREVMNRCLFVYFYDRREVIVLVWQVEWQSFVR